MKKILKNSKGITITVLVVTVVILLILTSTIIMKAGNYKNVNKLNNLYADIKLLEDKVLEYHNDYGILPTKGEKITPNRSMEEGEYYEIDLSQLENLTLNYGKGSIDDKDIYIVNKNTLDVYYYKGIEYEESLYYTYEY